MPPHTLTPMKHTPGPWSIFHYEDGLLAGLNYIAPDNYPESPVVTVCRCESEAEAQANARLIVHRVNTFPALVEALEQMMHRMNLNGHFDDGCFYYNQRSASELEEPIRLAQAALAAAKPNDL
jgi:hypothetical protein